MTVIVPDSPALGGAVRALLTTRAEGNLAMHAGAVESAPANRARLLAETDLPAEPVWMEQVHGTNVLDVTERPGEVPVADAAMTRESGLPVAVMVADCVPIVFASVAGDRVGVVHAGWRGLAAGIIPGFVAAFGSDACAWLGPAIGPCCYEVDEVVRRNFAGDHGWKAGRDGDHWMMDVALIARQQLMAAGISEVGGFNACTRCDERFYSHREDALSGRFALIGWLAAS